MHQNIENNLLVLELLEVEVLTLLERVLLTVGNPVYNGVLVDNLLVQPLDDLLHLGQLRIVAGHVSSQDQLYGSFAEVNVLLATQFVQELELILV